jgi:hypothetical protein
VAASVRGNPVVQSAVENIELAESTDVPIIDTKDASDGDAKRNSEDIPGKCDVIPIFFCLYTESFK